MKHFRSVCNSFAILGICPNLLQQKYPFNIKILMVYLYYSLTIILCCVYVSQTVHRNFEELSDLIFRISVLCLLVAVYSVFVFKVKNFFHILNTCDEIVDKSKNIHKKFPLIFYTVVATMHTKLGGDFAFK